MEAQPGMATESAMNVVTGRYELMPFWSLFVPAQGWSHFCKCLKRNGGDDETRTRDLCRDSAPSIGNCLKLRGTDGYQNRALELQVTIVGP